MKYRLGFDCNVIGSVLLGGSTREKFVEILKEKDLQIFYCDELIEEIQKLSEVKYFQGKGITIEIIEEFLKFFKQTAKEIKLKSDIQINRDKKDNYLLNLSRDANLNYLITFDKDLLVMEKFEKTQILKINDFLDNYNELPF